MARRKSLSTSPGSTSPTTIGDLGPFIKTLRRQHTITLRRVDNIQRQLGMGEEVRKDSSLVSWWRRLIRRE